MFFSLLLSFFCSISLALPIHEQTIALHKTTFSAFLKTVETKCYYVPRKSMFSGFVNLTLNTFGYDTTLDDIIFLDRLWEHNKYKNNTLAEMIDVQIIQKLFSQITINTSKSELKRILDNHTRTHFDPKEASIKNENGSYKINEDLYLACTIHNLFILHLFEQGVHKS